MIFVVVVVVRQLVESRKFCCFSEFLPIFPKLFEMSEICPKNVCQNCIVEFVLDLFEYYQ
jgi:hypothetical protein